MDLQLNGRVAVVSGGSSGIGMAIAEGLAAEGARVVIVSRGKDKAEKAAESIRQSTGGQVEVYTGDTGKDELVSELGEFLRERCGRADILVNCAAEPAGQGVDPTVEEVTYDQLERQMNVKVMGYLRAAQSVIPLMRENAFGRIISISGMGARKAGDTVGSIRNISVVALGKNLAEDLQGTGITSVVLHPGYTKTDKVEAMISRRSKEEDRDEGEIEAELAGGNLSGFLPTPADVAALTCFVASPLSRAINGDVIACAGGAKTAIYI